MNEPGHIEICEEKIKKLVCSWSNKYEPELRAALAELVGCVQEDDAFWHRKIVPTFQQAAWPIPEASPHFYSRANVASSRR